MLLTSVRPSNVFQWTHAGLLMLLLQILLPTTLSTMFTCNYAALATRIKATSLASLCLCCIAPVFVVAGNVYVCPVVFLLLGRCCYYLCWPHHDRGCCFTCCCCCCCSIDHLSRLGSIYKTFSIFPETLSSLFHVKIATSLK